MENTTTKEAFSPRLFLMLFAPLAALILGGAWYVGHDRIKGEMDLIRSGEIGNVITGVRRLDGELAQPLRHLRKLTDEAAFRQAVDNGDPQSQAALTDVFARLLNYSGLYDKLRWIDETGMERVRVNSSESGPRVVATAQLQNSAGSYYFSKAMGLKPGQIYISPLDLNVEHGKMESPHKPVLRLATPVRDAGGKPRGALILDVSARRLLDAFTESLVDARDHMMLLNGEGYWLRSPDSADEWGFMFKRKVTLGSRSPEAWKTISAIPSGQVELADGMWTWSTVYPLKAEVKLAEIPSWLVVAHFPANQLALISDQVWTQVGGMALVLLALSGGGAAWLTLALSGRTQARVEAARANAEAAAANRLNETLQRFHLVVEANANGLMAVDTEGRIVLANPALERMFGYEHGELLGKPMEVLVPEAHRAPHPKLRQDYMRTPAARPMGTGRELTGRRKDGGEFPVEISLSPFSERGQHYVDAVVVDISERKRVEQLLRKREAHLELLVRTNPNGMLVADSEGRIELANPALERLFGYEPGELLGQPVECLLTDADREHHVGLRAEYLKNPVIRHMAAGRDLRGRRKDGDTIPVEVGLASFIEDGRVYLQATVVAA